MPVTENSLRDLLRERSAQVPAAPELAQRVQQRVRRRRRLEAGAGVVGLVLALVATGLVVLPHHDAAPPVSAPRHRSTQMMESSLRVTTDGPTRIEGEKPFDVTLEITNTGSTAWTGTASVGVAHPGEVPGWVGLNQLLTTEDNSPYYPMVTQGPAAVADRSSAQQFSGLSVGTVVLEAGQSRTWTMRGARVAGASVLGPVLGWIPFVDRANTSDEVTLGSLDEAVPVDVTPRASNLPCDTVTITSAALGEPTGWQISDAATTVVDANRATLWTPVQIDGGPDGVEVTTDAPADAVRDSTVVAAVTAYLAQHGPAVRGTGFPPAITDEPAQLDPGRYVAYAGARLVPIAITGTCGPSGRTIRGTWTAFYRGTEGLLDCTTTPPKDSAGWEARRYCPA